MAANKQMTFRPTWGDLVNVVSAEGGPRIASVVGIAEVESQHHAEITGSKLGATVYLVEFGDGASVEVPLEKLAPYTLEE